MKKTNKQWSFDKLYRNSLQDKVIDKNEYESYVIFLLNMLMKTKMNLFYKYKPKIKIELFK